MLLATVGLAALVAGSCGRSPRTGEPQAGAEAPGTQQVFQVKGVIKGIMPREKQIQIQHEEIPGFMPAMTMPFDVKDTNELAGLTPGQADSFRLLVEDTEAWIDQIRKLEAAAETNRPSGAAASPIMREVDALEPGDQLPDYQFTNQFGNRFSTADFKGQALAVTFLFTRCPYPAYCPRLAASYHAVQQGLLRSKPALANWHLLAITIDPEYDQPEVLNKYGQTYAYDPRHWTLATGSLLDITRLGQQFGLAFWRDPNGGLSHNLRTAVIDAGGRVQKVFEGNNWTNDELEAEMVRAAGRVNGKTE